MRSPDWLLPRHRRIRAEQAFSRAAYLVLRAGHIRPTNKIARLIGEYSTILAMSQAARRDQRRLSGSRGRVLFFSGGPGVINQLSFHVALYRWLETEGYQCHLMVCDRFLDSCELKRIRLSDPERGALCDRCYQHTADACQAAGIPFTRASELLSGTALEELWESESRAEALGVDELAGTTSDGVALGKHALESSLRDIRRGTLPTDPSEVHEVLLSYVKGALRSKALGEACLDRFQPDKVVASHGFYASTGPAADVFIREGIPVAAFEPSPVFRGAYITSWNKPSLACDVRRTFLAERDQGLSSKEQQALREYLASRRTNSRDKVRFNRAPEVSCEETREALGIPVNARCFGMFPNLLWDAAAVARDVCFGDQAKWILSTVAYFERHPDRWLIVRPHPAEALRGTNEPVAGIIRAAYPELPPNVRLLDEAFRYNAYSVFNAIDAGLVNTSTVGLEMSLLGLPVVTVAETHYRGLGFTIDPGSCEEYFEALESLAEGGTLDAQQVQEAERYAHLYFLRHHIRLPFYTEARRKNMALRAHFDFERSHHDPSVRGWMHAFETGGDFVLPREESGQEASSGASSGRA